MGWCVTYIHDLYMNLDLWPNYIFLPWNFVWARSSLLFVVYGKPMSQKHVKKLINLTLKSQVNVVSGLSMFVTHPLMVIHPFAKYGKAMSRQKKVMGQTWRHVKNLINLTLRSKVNVVSDHEWTPHIVSRWYTHMPNMVSQCQSKKTIMGLTWICTDRLTVKRRDKVIPIYSPELGFWIWILSQVQKNLSSKSIIMKEFKMN